MIRTLAFSLGALGAHGTGMGVDCGGPGPLDAIR